MLFLGEALFNYEVAEKAQSKNPDKFKAALML